MPLNESGKRQNGTTGIEGPSGKAAETASFESMLKKVAKVTAEKMSSGDRQPSGREYESPAQDLPQMTDDVSAGVSIVDEDPLARAAQSRPVHWSIVWSDLMMIMFIFFLIMFVYEASNREFWTKERVEVIEGPGLGSGRAFDEGGAGSGSMEEGSISKIYDLSRQALESEDMMDFASIDLVKDKTVRIILKGDLLFDTGKADLKGAAKKSLGRIADLIRDTPYMINVVGHTDSVPIHSEKYSTNWELSVVRAVAVARFLIEDKKMDGKQFFVTGHAFYQPVAPNDTEKNRKRNRRVEIVITREKPTAES
ncbi:MAG: flagellar motor protein MotB [Thermodesulfobacteriota bacterium]|nr:flagellar motor protein MotB [Thermodesulfobacteriota bacterium]